MSTAADDALPPALPPASPPLSDLSHDQTIATIRGLIKNEGERWTTHRQQIVAALLAHGHHPTMEEVLALAKRQDQHLSAATVYRTLTVLMHVGAVRRIAIDGHTARYEITVGRHPHHHLVQVDGSGVEEFHDRALDAAIERILLERGLELAGRGIELFVQRRGTRQSSTRWHAVRQH
jgi:Fur family ferric uptake transcriptional regulator